MIKLGKIVNTLKTKQLCVGGLESALKLENRKKCADYNYLRVIINSNGKNIKEIIKRRTQGRIAIKRPNGTQQNKNKAKQNAQLNIIITSIALTYRVQAWGLNEADRKINAVEKDALNRSDQNGQNEYQSSI